ncbi:ABC transporter ATP-binding protein [Clostridium thermosuccinogenes]|uniref:ABC transporter ATP-binding protein n=1 Tax=Clostridium thermosuccinogenes TaxID=84032 RepID=UPI000CCC9F18|nr:ABC transporter ATP-binding protein [Pseudoclostridium thermosuccinogenes]PNT92658.1 sodium ABC transporter ATP-binding protein [Pseudoclostridium thermosuccinogenes]
MEPILEIKGLRKSYGDFSIKGIDLVLEKGYIMGFIGPNGAGKSTTIKLIMNLLKKDGGEIKVFGKDNVKFEHEIKNRIGFVYDENYFYEELTISEMKWIIEPFYKTWDEKAYKKYIKKFELPEKKKIKELSKGMKMKLSLTIALSHNADLLIMDEPTSGLDPLVRSELLETLSEVIQDENKAVFFSTHITSDLDKIADYVTLIHNGEILFSESKDDILSNYGMVKGGKEILGKDASRDFVGVRQNRFGFEALTKDKNQIKRKYGDKIIIEKPTLEEIMLYHTRREQNAV